MISVAAKLRGTDSRRPEVAEVLAILEAAHQELRRDPIDRDRIDDMLAIVSGLVESL